MNITPLSHWTDWEKNENSLAQSFLIKMTDNVNKVNATTDEGILKSKYVETADSTDNDLKHFKYFLFYKHFYKMKYYDDMHPISYQPAHFFHHC